MPKKHCVILTGAGISAESGLKTFRTEDGLWENYRVEDVATLEGWKKNPKLVLNFYNDRRRQVQKAKPNAGHQALVLLEEKYRVSIITQNIDNLHEKAGSSFVLHLHGEIMKLRSSIDENLIYPTKGDTKIGELCKKHSQLRPFVVWFGEPVPLIIEATRITKSADLMLVIGTSLAVYPAARLLQEIKIDTPLYLVDLETKQAPTNATIIQKKATQGVTELVKKLL